MESKSILYIAVGSRNNKPRCPSHRRRVLAKIAYKDWKQTKIEEQRLKKKREAMERRQGMFNDDSQMHHRRMARHSSARGLGSENSSRYINTEHKRN